MLRLVSVLAPATLSGTILKQHHLLVAKGNSAESISLTLTGCSFLQHAGGTKEGLCSPPAVAGPLCTSSFTCITSPLFSAEQARLHELNPGHRVGKSTSPPLRHTAISPTTLEVRAWPHTSRPLHTASPLHLRRVPDLLLAPLMGLRSQVR